MIAFVVLRTYKTGHNLSILFEQKIDPQKISAPLFAIQTIWCQS